MATPLALCQVVGIPVAMYHGYMMTPVQELQDLTRPVATLPTFLWAAPGECDLKRVAAISNIGWNKPNGGLWLAPAVDGTSVWIAHMERVGWNAYATRTLQVQQVALRPDARILTIDSYDDFQRVLSAYLLIDEQSLSLGKIMGSILDFEALARDFDGIYLTAKGQAATSRMKFGELNLKGWDLESILLFNTEAVAEVSLAVRHELAMPGSSEASEG